MTSFRALSAAFAACVCVAGLGLTGCTGMFEQNVDEDTSAAKPAIVETVALPPRAEPVAMVQASEDVAHTPSVAFVTGARELVSLMGWQDDMHIGFAIDGDAEGSTSTLEKNFVLTQDLPGDSPYSQLGLAAGDRLASINGHAVNNMQDLRSAVVKLKHSGAQALEVTFTRARGGQVTTQLPMCCQ